MHDLVTPSITLFEAGIFTNLYLKDGLGVEFIAGEGELKHQLGIETLTSFSLHYSTHIGLSRHCMSCTVMSQIRSCKAYLMSVYNVIVGLID